MRTPPGSSRRKLRAAAILQLIQGGLMEGGPFVGMIVLLALGIDESSAGRHFSLVVPYFQDNLYLMMAMSGIFGALRVFGAVGLLRNRMWGLALSGVNCVVTLILMVFMLPAGIADGLLSGAALIFLLLAWFGNSPILAGTEPPRDAGNTYPNTLPVSRS